MELKALMQKLETINSKQYLTESEEKEQADKKPCPPMSHVKKMCQDGKSVAEICKMHPDCDHTELKQMVADCKETMSKDKKKTDESIMFTSSIARGLAEEFGYELEEETLEEVAFSPEQQAKMGKANPQDPYIVARVLGKDAVPLSHFTDPEDQKIAKQIGFKDGPTVAPGGAATKPSATPAVAPGGVQAMGDDDGNTMITKPDGTVQVVGPDGKPLANGGKVDAGAATKPTTGTPPVGGAGGDAAVKATREKLTALLDKLEKTGGVSGSAPAPAAPTAPAAPAKPTTGAATKPAAPVSGAQSAGQSVGGAIKSGAQAVGDFAKGAYQGLTKESISFEDDQTLLAIKNIRY